MSLVLGPLQWWKQRRRANQRLKKENIILYKALGEMVMWSEKYMNYHSEKFYEDSDVKPTGLWPTIQEAKQAMAKVRSLELGEEV